MIYELREYVAHPGTTERLHERFARDTLPVFAEHGIEPIGFWTDAADPSRIVYVVAFADEAAQKQAWVDFQADERWQRAKSSSEAAGPIVAEMSSRTLLPVGYWPGASPSRRSDR